MHNHKEYLENVEKKLVDEGVLTPDIVNFYKAIFDYQMKYYNIFKDIAFDPSFIRSVELPMIDTDKISFSEEIESKLNDGLSAISSIIKDYQSGMDLEPIIQYISDNKNSADFIKSLLNRDIEKLESIANECKIGADESIFIILNWLKPLFINLMEKNNEKINHDDWLTSNCPFCGYYPDMAMIVEQKEGKKFLHCAFCENEWPYERIACTVCDNKDAEKLGYFVTEEENIYRIDYCESCKGYIKTLRIPVSKNPERYDLCVENILTLYLDNLTMEKGFSRP